MRWKSLSTFSFSLLLLSSILFPTQSLAVESEVPNNLESIDSNIFQSVAPEILEFVDPEVIKSYLSEEQIIFNKAPELSPFGIPALDKMKFSDYFYLGTSNWITRNGVISLSLKPKPNSPLRTTSGNIQLGHAYRAFQLVSGRHSFDSRWKNNTGMSHQFHCHVQFAGTKSDWNLEPHRTETNYLVYIQHKCNPPNK